MARCTATAKRTGEQCEQAAIKGGVTCWHHGSATGAARAAADRRLAAERVKRAVGKLEIRPVQDPFRALQMVAGEMVAIKDKVRELVEELPSLRYRSAEMSEQTRAEMSIYSGLLRDCTTSLTALARLRLEDRAIELADDEVRFFLRAVEASLRAGGLEGYALERAKKEFFRRLKIDWQEAQERGELSPPPETAQ